MFQGGSNALTARYARSIDQTLIVYSAAWIDYVRIVFGDCYGDLLLCTIMSLYLRLKKKRQWTSHTQIQEVDQ